jgi:hypothetical protein
VVGVVTGAGGVTGARSTGADGLLTTGREATRRTEWVSGAACSEGAAPASRPEASRPEDSAPEDSAPEESGLCIEPASAGAVADRADPVSGFAVLVASAPLLVAAGACVANATPNTPATAADASAVALVTIPTRRRPWARTTGPSAVPPTHASEPD